MRAAVFAIACVGLSVAALATDETAFPNEYLGTTVFFVPKHGAERDYGDHGFVAFVLQTTDENNIKPTFIAHSASEFVVGFQRIPRELQRYGIWLMLQKGDPYSPEEKAMLQQLKTLCAKHKFPLSIRTGWDDVWQSFSGTAHQRSNQAMERTPKAFASKLADRRMTSMKEELKIKKEATRALATPASLPRSGCGQVRCRSSCSR